MLSVPWAQLVQRRQVTTRMAVVQLLQPTQLLAAPKSSRDVVVLALVVGLQ
jgi:hypothetical protein